MLQTTKIKNCKRVKNTLGCSTKRMNSYRITWYVQKNKKQKSESLTQQTQKKKRQKASYSIVLWYSGFCSDFSELLWVTILCIQAAAHTTKPCLHQNKAAVCIIKLCCSCDMALNTHSSSSPLLIDLKHTHTHTANLQKRLLLRR